MPNFNLPDEVFENAAAQFPTPFTLYDEQGIRENARRVKQAFAWNPGFREYFAVKAAPNHFLLKILREEGCGCDCSSLTELDLSGWDTSSVLTEMNRTFYGCSSLTSLNLSGWDTSGVTNMNGLFRGCSNLTSLDLSSFDTSKVTNMVEMFRSCTKLTSLDLSSFDTAKAANISSMFYSCTKLVTIYVSSYDSASGKGWVTVTPSNTNVFAYCTKLVGGNGTAYSTAQVKTAEYARIDGEGGEPGYFTKAGA